MHAHTRRAKTVLFAAFAFACAGRVHAASSVTVTDTGDGTVNDSLCTLREAITAANSQASFDGCVFSGSGSPTTIAFAIPGSGVQTIDVSSQLPAIAMPVVVDGLTQPGASCAAWPPTLLIQISSPTNGQYNGFTLNPGSDGSTIRGLVINGFNNNMVRNFQSFGATLVQFQKFEPRFGPGRRDESERNRKDLTLEDAMALKAEVPEMRAVSPERYLWNTDVHVKYRDAETTTPTVLGCMPDYSLANNHFVSYGRFLTDTDIDHSAPVVVIGEDVREALFAREDPLNK